MIDILPTLALCTVRDMHDKDTLVTWALVLSSRRFLCRIDPGPRLMVAPALAKAAVAEILAYESENMPQPRPLPLPDNSWVSIAVITTFVVLNAWLDSRNLGDQLALYASGRLDAALVVQGQWWRCVTALFLHADAGHLMSNVIALGVLASLLGRRIGSGLTWGLFVLSGALGNALNAWVQAPDHLSVGASTGVFGLIGVLAGSAGRAEPGRRATVVLLSGGFGLSLLALLGAGEERVDLGAHLFGLCCGLPFGMMLGGWHGVRGWRQRLNVVAGMAAASAMVWAWQAALNGY